MQRYRKKPVVIEAIQYTPETCKEICGLLGISHSSNTEDCGKGQMPVKTLEGVMYANPGDYIIKGIKGEYYPCKPDIFIATYEKIED